MHVCGSGKLTANKSRFQEEFPELAAGADDRAHATAQKKEDENRESQHGPGPSLRPQSKLSHHELLLSFQSSAVEQVLDILWVSCLGK